jgi:hypothetical protein
MFDREPPTCSARRTHVRRLLRYVHNELDSTPLQPCRYDRAARSTCANCGQKTGQSGRTLCGDCRYGPDPQLHTMTDVEKAWLAGIIEGEGTFGRVGRPGGQIRVVMTDQDVIHRLHAITGLGLIHEPGTFPASAAPPIRGGHSARRGARPATLR